MQFQPGAEKDVAWGQAEHHRGHQATADSRNALQKLHDLAGGKPGQQGNQTTREELRVISQHEQNLTVTLTPTLITHPQPAAYF